MIYSQPSKVLLSNCARFFKLKNWPTFILAANIMRYIVCGMDLLHPKNYVHISLILQFIRWYLVMSGSFGTNFIHNCVWCASIISVIIKGQGYKWIIGNTFCYHMKHSTTAILPHDWLNQKCTPTLHQKHARKKMPPALLLLQKLMFFWKESCTTSLLLQPFFHNHEQEPEIGVRLSTSRIIIINID